MSRIYPKGNFYYYFSATAISHPKTGKIAKWHSLCRISEGMARAERLARELAPKQSKDTGNMPAHFRRYRERVMEARKERAHELANNPERLRMWEKGTTVVVYWLNLIENAFSPFNLDQIQPSDVADFLDQWEGRRTAQVLKSELNKFFRWAIRRGYMNTNPSAEITVERPKKRKVLVTDDQFAKVKAGALKAKCGRRNPSGEMMSCYIDLCFLLLQRNTEVRILKKSDIRDGLIYFTPTKTEASSGTVVAVPVTPEIQAVLNRASACYPDIKSEFVIHTRKGTAYTTDGIRTLWRKAAQRQGITGITSRDLRPMAITTAKRAGFDKEDLRVAAAHTSVKMTEHYIREQEIPVSNVSISLPKAKPISLFDTD